MNGFISEQLLNKDIYLDPKNLNHNLIDNIKNKIKNSIEGKCNEIGYVIKDSVTIIHKSNGKLININNHNNILYNIKYKCKLIIPTIGEVIKCYIKDITEAGVIGYIKIKDYITDYKDNDFTDTPIICIVPLNRFDEPENLKVDDKINIRVTAIRKKYNQINIQLVGTPVV
jgi:DNA-directed RNA polymerase subunit E'/Rpb7